ncbi:MAG: acyl-CoA ligase (AMP-forming), exosortase A system-associated [Candidatus Korobacteraceae bacterium]
MDYLIHHMLQSSARRYPHKEAIVHGQARLSYSKVASRCASAATSLREAGLQRGDRVGIYLDPSVDQVLAIFSICQAGGVYVPVNTVLFPEQVAHIVRDCGMKALITTAEKLETLLPVLQEVPSLEFYIVTGEEGDSEQSLAAGQKRPVNLFRDMLKAQAPEKWVDWGISKDLAAILYTSGSTGKPKGVMLSHANIMAGSSIVSTYLEITECERILAVLPFTFDAGMNQLMTAFQQGGTIVLIKFVFAKEIIAALIDERITALAGVPTVWSLLTNGGLQKHEFPHLRYITNTGGAMPQTVLKVLRQALPTTKIFLMYGLTEAFRSTYLPPEELDRRPTSMGKAIPDNEILVVNEEGKLCGPGEVGELVHRGSTVSMGYWGNPEATAKVLRPNPLLPAEVGDSERVCYSGDLVKMDEDGYLYYVGRRDTMIKSSGYRISPTEVEEVLFQTGKIRQAAVIGLPDEVMGQSIKAFIVPKNGDQLDCESILGFCSEKMPRHMVPKCLELLSELPKTSSGKVDYPALRRREGL